MKTKLLREYQKTIKQMEKLFQIAYNEADEAKRDLLAVAMTKAEAQVTTVFERVGK